MFDEFFETASGLTRAGRPFATALVVRAEKPTSGKPGDRAIVTADGVMHGWIGGSCAQPTVIQQARLALADGRRRLVRLSPDPGSEPLPEGVVEVPMTCFSGGTLDIFIEPHHPRPRLLVVGTLPVSRALAHLGKAMNYHVCVVEPGEGPPAEHADETLRELDELASRVTPLSFVVVATHGEYDEPALTAALGTDVPYIGLVASRERGRAVVESLARAGVEEEALGRIRFPAGLDIGAQRGDEIALSIMAEVIQVRRRLEDLSWSDEGGLEVGEGEAGPGGAAEAEAVADRPAVAVDPVCGMQVTLEGAMHTFEHEGTTFYFCCGGCRSRFVEDPDSYLAASG
jgi:xanthine dehydrogenase accessory factor